MSTHTHIQTAQGNKVLIYSMCVNITAATAFFPRNFWHKLPLSHYLMTKHSHKTPPMPPA